MVQDGKPRGVYIDLYMSYVKSMVLPRQVSPKLDVGKDMRHADSWERRIVLARLTSGGSPPLKSYLARIGRVALAQWGKMLREYRE